jgi:hypothetical protein
MIDDSLLPFSLPSVDRKKITAAFDGGRISSDGGVMLLALAERRMGLANKLAAEITDRRDPTRVIHALSDILRARILAIACGYEDADDLDYLRSDPPPSSWPVATCRIAGTICVRSQLCRVARMRRACAR